MATRKDSYDWKEIQEKTAEAARDTAMTGWEWTKKILRKSAQLTTNSALLMKRLTKRQRFKLSKVQIYLHRNELNKLATLIKQNKANIELKRYGWSFLISGRDLLPVLHYIPPGSRKFTFDDSDEKSDKQFIRDADKKIQKVFYEYAFEDFSERAWGAVPQYIAPTLVSSLHVKQAVALQLFCSKNFKILLTGNRTRKKILDSASEIDSSLVVSDIGELSGKEQKEILSVKKLLAGSKNKTNSLHKNFNLTLPVKKISLKKFTDLVESLVVQEVQINRNDIFFIKRYIKHAQKIKVKLSPRIANKVKKFAINLEKKKNISKKTIEGLIYLLRASAAMELRDQVENKDLARVFQVYRKIYW